MTDMKYSIALIIVLGIALGVYDLIPLSDADKDELAGRVVRVVDGDSLYVEGIETQIRLFGVDAPEREEPGYKIATETLSRITDRQNLSCNHVDTDRYDRIIGRCFLSDGKEVNRLMIESKTTREYCRYSNGLYGHC